MKKLIYLVLLIVGVISGCDYVMNYPIIKPQKQAGTNAWDDFNYNPFKPDPNFEKKFVYRRDHYHHHYTQDKDGNWNVEYVKECPDKHK